MTSKIFTLHIRDRWGGDNTTGHKTLALAIAAALAWDTSIEDRERKRVEKAITDGNLGIAEELVGELLGQGSHEMTIACLEVDTIEWNYLPELPDEETTVLMAHGKGDADVSEGYLDAGVWYYQHHAEARRIKVSDVYAWAHMPAGPKAPPRR